MNNRKSGIEGEDIAVEYLKKQGYLILERNYKTMVGEIDIIAKDKDTIVFVEVKARDNTKFGMPIESITPYKVQRIIRTAQWYLSATRNYNCPCRFDVVEILRGEVIYTPNAFTL